MTAEGKTGRGIPSCTVKGQKGKAMEYEVSSMSERLGLSLIIL